MAKKLINCMECLNWSVCQRKKMFGKYQIKCFKKKFAKDETKNKNSKS